MSVRPCFSSFLPNPHHSLCFPLTHECLLVSWRVSFALIRRKFARDLQAELRDEYSVDLRKEWDLKDPSWRYDTIPEILDGKNVADFVDPDIDDKLQHLEVRHLSLSILLSGEEGRRCLESDF